jgi:hypothetical protein
VKTEKIAFVALELTVILVMSWVATIGFESVMATFSKEISSFQNIIYLIAIVLSFVSIHHYSKRSAFVFLLILSIFLLILTTQNIWPFSITVFFLASMLGVFTVVLIPAARGNEFAVFLTILSSPLILVESRLIGSMITQEMGMPFYQVYLISLVLVGGYLFLRHVTRIKLMERELVSKGGDTQELTFVSWRSSIFAITIVACAIGINAALTEFMIALTNQIGYHQNGFFVFLLIFAWIVGVAILTCIYVISEKL